VDYYESFNMTKIMYGHFQSKPLYHYDSTKMHCNNKGYIIPNADYFLLAYLNSYVSWFLFTSMTTMVRGGFYEATTQNINRIPIPKATSSQKKRIASLAESCQSRAELRYALQNGLRKEIASLCPEGQNPRLNNKLKSWWLLSFDDFKKEIKKVYKYSMTLEQSMNWQGIFETYKQQIQQHSAELASTEARLNNKVYELFALDADEIDLLEQSLR
jgi:hypothetical protein